MTISLVKMLDLDVLQDASGIGQIIYAKTDRAEFSADDPADMFRKGDEIPDGYVEFGDVDWCCELSDSFDDSPSQIINYINETNAEIE